MARRQGRVSTSASRFQIRCSTLCSKSTTGSAATGGHVGRGHEEVGDADVDAVCAARRRSTCRRSAGTRQRLHVHAARRQPRRARARAAKRGAAAWRAARRAPRRPRARPAAARVSAAVASSPGRVGGEHASPGGAAPARATMWKLRSRPPVLSGQRPPTFTHRMRSGRHAAPSSAAGVLAVDEDAVPDLEVGEQPQPLAVVGGAARGARRRGAARRRDRRSRAPRARPEHELLDERPERARAASGRRAPGIPSSCGARIAGGTTSRDRLAQHRLRLPAAQLEARPGSPPRARRAPWSRNGTRLSIEAAMLIWSCFISSSHEVGLDVGAAHAGRGSPPASRVDARARSRTDRGRQPRGIGQEPALQRSGKTAKFSKKSVATPSAQAPGSVRSA